MSIFDEITADLHALGYNFRVNDLDDTMEVDTVHGWQPMDDYLDSIIRIEMRDLGYGTKDKPSMTAMAEAVNKLAHTQRYNPIRHHFDELEKRYRPGQNGPYVIANCAHHFDNPDGYFPTWLFKWMVGAVAKAYCGARNPMLVLAGPQHIGKSWFSSWLCPLTDHFVRGSIQPDNKDHKLRLATSLVWEADELGSTTKRADADALKSFLTLSEIYERPPFKKFAVRKPVVTSFIGTANFDGSGLLNDPTGTTRFLACEITHIDFGYAHIDVNELWAEAVWFYKHVPGSWELTKDQKEAQKRINTDFEIISALSDTIENIFDIEPDGKDFMTTAAIKSDISLHYRISNEQSFYNELARVLTKMGLQKGREFAGGKRGWYGIKPKNNK